MIQCLMETGSAAPADIQQAGTKRGRDDGSEEEHLSEDGSGPIKRLKTAPDAAEIDDNDGLEGGSGYGGDVDEDEAVEEELSLQEEVIKTLHQQLPDTNLDLDSRCKVAMDKLIHEELSKDLDAQVPQFGDDDGEQDQDTDTDEDEISTAVELIQMQESARSLRDCGQRMYTRMKRLEQELMVERATNEQLRREQTDLEEDGEQMHERVQELEEHSERVYARTQELEGLLTEQNEMLEDEQYDCQELGRYGQRLHNRVTILEQQLEGETIHRRTMDEAIQEYISQVHAAVAEALMANPELGDLFQLVLLDQDS